MTEDVPGDGARYRAFISYSHRDAAFGRRLHRRLEAYRIPRRLVGRTTPLGQVPRRLAPIFRDREELPAADDLTAEVRTALAASGALIVVCSPAAAASPWVAREVETFRSMHPDRPVLAAIADGEPAEAFPTCLTHLNAAGETVEPLAADFRKGRDGERLGLLKLVAGVVALGLDELVQRDAQSRLQRVTAVTAAALVLAVGMGGLALYALDARAEAERQRAEAEGMVEFMLTDLRTKLKGVGRLDVLTAANQRALDYYRKQDLKRLAAPSLERRARVLHAMGEDDERRGDHDAALAHFREARRTTGTLLAARPDDPERIFAHSQSEYWIGYVDYQRGRVSAAMPGFEAYKRLTDRLVALRPDDPIYLREAGYAEGNLCSVALEAKQRRPASALQSCKAALGHMERAARRLGPDRGIAVDLVNRHAWVADAYLASGDRAQARAHRLIQERLLSALMRDDPRNVDLKELWVSLQRAFAKLEMDVGRREDARRRLQQALSTLNAMIEFDPSNNEWLKQRARIERDLQRGTSRSSQKEKQS